MAVVVVVVVIDVVFVVVFVLNVDVFKDMIFDKSWRGRESKIYCQK